MKLYLVQHGKAASKEEDPERGLTPQGLEETRKAARFLAELDLSVNKIWHSGKTRSRQTAEIFASALSQQPELHEKEGLAPNDNPDDIAYLLRNTEHPVLITGHLPFLSRLTGILLCGSPDKGCVAFRNSGVVCLERFEESGQWALIWAIVPGLL